MLDRKDLERIKLDLDRLDKEREKVFQKSREIVKISKKAIYALHRNKVAEAEKHIKVMSSSIRQLQAYMLKKPKLMGVGSYKVAVQEYVEAVAFYEIIKNKRVPTCASLKVDREFYLLGLIDVTGEVVRRAINAAINEKYGEAVELKNLIASIYDELMQFNFSNGELRKKFDSVKYDLKKLEDLVLNLKLSGKI